VQRQPRAEALVNPTRNNRPTKRARRKPPPNVRRPTVDENLDPENFPEQLESFAADVTTFLNCLNEFPEFTDEAVNAAIISFQSDLKVRMHPVCTLGYVLTADAVLGILFESIQK
jgi:WD repeat-containing protein 26